MSDIRFNQWLHNSGTGGVSQVDGGHVGIGTTNPEIAVHSGNNKILNVGIVTASTYYGDGSNLTGITDNVVNINNNADNKIITGSGSANTLEAEATLTYSNNGSAAMLNVKRSTTSGQETILYYDANYFDIETREATGMRLKTNTGDRLIINADGKIGVSRVATQHPFEIGHASSPTQSFWRGSTKGFAISAESAATYLMSYQDVPLIFSVSSGSSYTERLRITSAGIVQINQGTAGGNHFEILNDEIKLVSGANGTGDTYDREGFLGVTRVDSGSYPILRLAGQGGIKFCVDANSPRALLTSTGQFLFDTQTAFTSVAYRKIQIGQTDGGWINLARTGVPSDGNHLGAIQGFTKGANGSYHDTTAMDFKADGTQSNSSKGSKIEFWTTPENSTTKTLSVVINREGKFRTYDTVLGGDYSHHHQGWMQTRTFSVPIINNQTRWYKIVNYAAGTMLVGKLDIYTSRGGGFNQTKGYSEWRISYNGYNNLIYGTAGDNTNFETGHAAGVEVVTGGSPKNVYIKVQGSIYGGRCYFKLEGTINNWQWDEGTYETSAP